MSTVGIIFKIMPTSPDVDRDALRTTIEETLDDRINLQQITENPIAFGLVALMVHLTMEEEAGDPDELAETLEALANVESVSVEQIGLV